MPKSFLHTDKLCLHSSQCGVGSPQYRSALQVRHIVVTEFAAINEHLANCNMNEIRVPLLTLPFGLWVVLDD